MQSSVKILMGAVLALAITLLLFVVTRPAPGLGEADVRQIVSEMMAEQPGNGAGTGTSSAISANDINPIIEEYLLANPRMLEIMAGALQAENLAEEIDRTRSAMVSMSDYIYNDPSNIILGNPDGDVTLVEFFDYNCPYCKQVMPHIPALIDSDPNLKIIIKEFPILGQDSVDAARVSVAVHQAGGDYWAFHEAMFTGRGTVTAEKAMTIAAGMGLDVVALEQAAGDSDVDDVLKNSYAIAEALSINGTPAFIIGSEVIPGAVSLEALEDRIANMRECGQSQCGG